MKGFQESQGHVAYMTACSIQRQTEKAVFVQPEEKVQGDLIQLPNGRAQRRQSYALCRGAHRGEAMDTFPHQKS